MSNTNSQHKFSSQRGKTAKRKDRAILYPPFLTKYLKQQVREYQETIDFLESHYGQAAARELCQKPAQHIVVLNAVISSLDELQELRARQRQLLDFKLDELKSGQGPEPNSNTKPSP